MESEPPPPPWWNLSTDITGIWETWFLSCAWTRFSEEFSVWCRFRPDEPGGRKLKKRPLGPLNLLTSGMEGDGVTGGLIGRCQWWMAWEAGVPSCVWLLLPGWTIYQTTAWLNNLSENWASNKHTKKRIWTTYQKNMRTDFSTLMHWNTLAIHNSFS